MKKILLVLLAGLLISCGPPLKPDGNFDPKAEHFVGRFHGIDVYQVWLSVGYIYIGVKAGSDVSSVNTTGKGSMAIITDNGPSMDSHPEKDITDILKKK